MISYTPYTPSRWLKDGHRMTLYTWIRPRRFPNLPHPNSRYFDVANNARILAHCHWQPKRHQHPTLIALHGLEGSSHAHYMRGLAEKAFAKGFNVIRLNQRNCGGTEHLSTGLYHSGLSSDPAAVIKELIELDGLQSIAIVGYSLGGNVALKLAGEYGQNMPAGLQSICAVSPTMDLARCVDALERPENYLYTWNFVRNLKRRMRRKARIFPDYFNLNRLNKIKTVRAFDEAFTAPHHGFLNSDDYYFHASSLRVVNHIKIPTLIISSADDPFVPADQFHDRTLTENSHITVLITQHGGHCGFVMKPVSGFDGYWAERTVIDFSNQHTFS